MSRKEKNLFYHRSTKTKSKSDFSEEEVSAPQVNRIPLERLRHRPPSIRLRFSSSVRFRILGTESGRLKLSKDQIRGEILNVNEEGMLISTDHPVPEEDFLLATFILNQKIILEGVLEKIKRVEFQDNGDLLVGVEFSSIGELKRLFSPQEIESLPIKPGNLKQKLHYIINSQFRKGVTAQRDK